MQQSSIKLPSMYVTPPLKDMVKGLASSAKSIYHVLNLPGDYGLNLLGNHGFNLPGDHVTHCFVEIFLLKTLFCEPDVKLHMLLSHPREIGSGTGVASGNNPNHAEEGEMCVVWELSTLWSE